MKQTESRSLYLFAIILASVSLSSCLYGSGTDSGASSACGPTQEMAGHTAVWSYEDCGPFSNVWIQQSAKDTFTGAILGNRNVGRGMLSFKYTGLHNRNFRLNEVTYGIFFLAEGFNRLEANWHWQTVNLGAGYVNNQMISQRSDITCRKNNLSECINTAESEALQFSDATEVIQWDCQWNADVFTLSCQVTKPNDPSFRLTLEPGMLGPYNHLKYLGVGNKAYDGGSPSFDVKVTDFKLTFFE
ncbi:MAG: hypothetical protein OEV92_10725 [Nitrospinota bacterium]|nr:hypothetical protein [Nitrospinota bacterium]